MTTRKILHLDLDAFFCACEELKDPSLAGKAFAVGGQAGRRGVIASCSYVARQKGVHSAMPTGQALRLCPELLMISGHHSNYGEMSEKVMAILGQLTPLLEQVSVDEAFMDVTDLPEDMGSIARKLQAQVWDDTHLPCSVGGATNKLVAKVATDTGKARNRGNNYPRAILIVPAGEEEAFLAPLPVKAMWGIGPKMEAALLGLGIRTIGDLAAYPPAQLEKRFGKYGAELAAHAHGIDDRPVTVEYEMKSISQETTYDKDTNDAEQLRQTLRALSQKVGFRLRQNKVVGKVVRIKMRWADFSTFTRQVSLAQPTDQDGVIFNTALKLFLDNWDHEQLIRLIGVGVSALEESSHQMSLFDTPNEKEHRLLSALDEIHEKYGKQSLTSADSLRQKPIKKGTSDSKRG
jgi:Nucleotidyltransferase/DNA polymerase involved in DNA repair